jgi:D-alanyl-D-alanine carboxypeptidase
VKLKINPIRAGLTAVCVVLIAFGVFSVSVNREGGGGDAGRNGAAYASLEYYDAKLRQRYEAYGAANPNMPPSEVVWRVDAGLDAPFYSNVREITDFTPPVLVNKHNRLPDGYEPEGLMYTSSGQMMTAETKTAYEALRDAAGEAGFHINAVAAYRSVEYQKGYYNKAVMERGKEAADRRVPRAGFSEHHLGVAIDLAVVGGGADEFAGTREAEWVAENAPSFGFITRYTAENADVTGYDAAPEHLTYVGAEVAGRMSAEGIGSLEEYWVRYVAYGINTSD